MKALFWIRKARYGGKQEREGEWESENDRERKKEWIELFYPLTDRPLMNYTLNPPSTHTTESNTNCVPKWLTTLKQQGSDWLDYAKPRRLPQAAAKVVANVFCWRRGPYRPRKQQLLRGRVTFVSQLFTAGVTNEDSTLWHGSCKEFIICRRGVGSLNLIWSSLKFLWREGSVAFVLVCMSTFVGKVWCVYFLSSPFWPIGISFHCFML